MQVIGMYKQWASFQFCNKADKFLSKPGFYFWTPKTKNIMTLF